MLEQFLSQEQLVSDMPAAFEAAETHAVILTRAGKPTSVLLSYDNYVRLLRGKLSMYEAFSQSSLSEEAAQYDLSDANLEAAPLEKSA
jgi:hypothetical protein